MSDLKVKQGMCDIHDICDTKMTLDELCCEEETMGVLTRSNAINKYDEKQIELQKWLDEQPDPGLNSIVLKDDEDKWLKVENKISLEEKLTQGKCINNCSSFNMISVKQKYTYKKSIIEFLENENIKEVICGHNWGITHYIYRSDNGRYYRYAYKKGDIVSCNYMDEERIRCWVDVSKLDVVEEENELKECSKLKRCNANAIIDFTYDGENDDLLNDVCSITYKKESDESDINKIECEFEKEAELYYDLACNGIKSDFTSALWDEDVIGRKHI
jgi:hypothetical protein